jgi:hypothetical protein
MPLIPISIESLIDLRLNFRPFWRCQIDRVNKIKLFLLKTLTTERQYLILTTVKFNKNTNNKKGA